MTKERDEIFGPILSVLEVQTNEEAISLANKTVVWFNRIYLKC